MLNANTPVPNGTNTTINNNTNPFTVGEPTYFVSPTRSILSFGARRSSGRTINRAALSGIVTLEDVRDQLVKIDKAQDARDILVNSRSLGLNFDGGTARCIPVLADKNGGRMDTETLYFDKNGWGKMGSSLLPRSGAGFEYALANLSAPHGVEGDALTSWRVSAQRCASQAYMMFAMSQGKDIVLRTVRKRIGTDGDGKPIVARFIRSCVSPSYAPVSNLELVNMVLEQLGNFSVFRGNLHDDGMYLRLLDLRETDGELDTGVYYPTVNIGNSDVGNAKVILEAGGVKLSCTNGMGEYSTNGSHSWLHRGDPLRIVNQFSDVLVSVRTAQSGLLNQFQRALEVQIDDGYSWMQNMLAQVNGISQKTIEGVRTAMDDETSARRGTLANVVDGMTLLAQNDDISLWDQIALEKEAVKVMRKGLKQAENNRLFAPA